jgi:predicted nucleic acid-binding protein
MSERSFVDSAAFFALADPRDDNHALAVATAQRLAREGADMYTTNFVVAEAHGLLLNRLDRDTAQRTLDRIYAGSIRIIRATERDETRAREIIHQQNDKEYSFTDAISFAVMERLHIRRAWTYDHHFRQYGFLQEP